MFLVTFFYFTLPTLICTLRTIHYNEPSTFYLVLSSNYFKKMCVFFFSDNNSFVIVLVKTKKCYYHVIQVMYEGCKRMNTIGSQVIAFYERITLPTFCGLCVNYNIAYICINSFTDAGIAGWLHNREQFSEHPTVAMH